MNNLRIVFFGTPDFAVAGLRKLVENGYEIAAVVTAPDKPAGRGRQVQESAVKRYAVANDIGVLQPTNLKDPDFLNEIKALNANLFIVVAFRMMPEVLWQMPTYGTFNLHASLLPQYRGAVSINWAIMNGETKTGVTTFFIDDKIDTGKILLQEACPITPEMTAGELHDVLMDLGAALIEKTVKLIEEGNLVKITQDSLNKGPLKEAPKIFKDDCQIDWSQPVKNIYNKIRGLSPYPAAWSVFQHKTNHTKLTFKIFNAVYTEEAQGDLFELTSSEKGLGVKVKDGQIFITELQLQGKKRMNSVEFLRGFDLDEYHIL